MAVPSDTESDDVVVYHGRRNVQALQRHRTILTHPDFDQIRSIIFFLSRSFLDHRDLRCMVMLSETFSRTGMSLWRADRAIAFLVENWSVFASYAVPGDTGSIGLYD